MEIDHNQMRKRWALDLIRLQAIDKIVNSIRYFRKFICAHITSSQLE